MAREGRAAPAREDAEALAELRPPRFLLIGLLLFGFALLYVGLTDISLAQGEGVKHDRVRRAACRLYRLLEGAFGGLIATLAGVGAIISSAFGGFRMAVGMLVTGVGAFTLRSLISLFFGVPDCGDAWQPGAAAPNGTFATGG